MMDGVWESIVRTTDVNIEAAAGDAQAGSADCLLPLVTLSNRANLSHSRQCAGQER